MAGGDFEAKASFDGFFGDIHEVRWAQDVPPPTDPSGAIGAWLLSPAQVDALNPKSSTLNPKP